ncbi:MAG: DUF11 domain-containing protein [Proteobacteria bacterium]|nr:DUF11 domain-containing protein [Pseudomonadota bacterium]
MKITQILAFILLATGCQNLLAQSADIAVEMTFPGMENGVIYDQQGDFTITVTNLGPDEAVPPAGGGSFFFVGSSVVRNTGNYKPDIFFELDGANSPPECVFFIAEGSPLPGQLPNYGYSFIYFGMAAFDSVTCLGKYTVFFEEGERTVLWEAINQHAPDPDLSNNLLGFTFGIRPMTIPINSPTALFLLLILILISSRFAIRGFPKTR